METHGEEFQKNVIAVQFCRNVKEECMHMPSHEDKLSF